MKIFGRIVTLFVAVICFATQQASGNESVASRDLIAFLYKSHSNDIKEFKSSSRSCRLEITELHNAKEAAATVAWTGCSFYCGSAGCRVLVLSKPIGKSWVEVTDSNFRSFSLIQNESNFLLNVDLHPSSAVCTPQERSSCKRTAIINGGKMTIR